MSPIGRKVPVLELVLHHCLAFLPLPTPILIPRTSTHFWRPSSFPPSLAYRCSLVPRLLLSAALLGTRRPHLPLLSLPPATACTACLPRPSLLSPAAQWLSPHSIHTLTPVIFLQLALQSPFPDFLVLQGVFAALVPSPGATQRPQTWKIALLIAPA